LPSSSWTNQCAKQSSGWGSISAQSGPNRLCESHQGQALASQREGARRVKT
jgi:hypothetical protein